MEKQKTITIHNIKSGNFRQFFVNGAYGGLTPQGYLNLNFYSERNPIPKGTVYELDENNVLGNEIENLTDSKEGAIREFEIGVFMDIDTCVKLRDYLTQKIEQFNSGKK